VILRRIFQIIEEKQIKKVGGQKGHSLTKKSVEEKIKIFNSKLLNTDATTARCENKNICVRTHSTKSLTLLVPTYGKG